MFCAVCLIFQQCSAVFAHSFFNFFPFTLTNYLARFCPVVHCSVNCYGSKTNKHAYISLQLAHAQTTCCVQNTLHSTLLKDSWCFGVFLYLFTVALQLYVVFLCFRLSLPQESFHIGTAPQSLKCCLVS